MTMSTDPELLGFAAELIRERGGLIEPDGNELLALLPSPVAKDIGLPEEVRLGSEQAPLLYGSPLLDRLIGLATRDVPVVYERIEVPYLKKAGFERLIGRDIVFVDGQVRVAGRADARSSYMILMGHYVALSDERREGLVRVGLHESSGAIVRDLVGSWEQFRPQFFEVGKVPPHFPVHIEEALSSGMKNAAGIVHAELSDFLSSMRRRLQRDVKNTREYYEALRIEMEASLSHPNLTEAQRQDRIAKIENLPQEAERKVEDIEQKYRVRVTISACAAVRLLVDVVQLMLDLRYRKARRSVRVIWNPITHRLDPLVCEHCHETTQKVHPVIEGSTIRLLCPLCT